MCVTVGVRAYLGKTMNSPALRSLWRHNLATAVIAQRVASTGFIDKDMAFTSGILHDIGRMALAVVQPIAYAEMLQMHRGSAPSILASERALIGMDHCEIGRQLISDWQLPECFEAVVADHHLDRCADQAWDIAELIKMSCAMAGSIGFPAFPGCVSTPFEELVERLPSRESRSIATGAASLKSEVTESIKAIETA